MYFSLFDEDLDASLTSAIMRIAVLSEDGAVTSTLITPDMFIEPESTLSPSITFKGLLSPVNEETSKKVEPSLTIPSLPILSPAITRHKSPFLSSDDKTVFILPSLVIRFAFSGCNARRSFRFFLLFSSPRVQKYSPSL